MVRTTEERRTDRTTEERRMDRTTEGATTILTTEDHITATASTDAQMRLPTTIVLIGDSAIAAATEV